MTSSLLLLSDPVLLYVAALLIGALYSQGLPSPLIASDLGDTFTRVVLLAAVLAPFFLYDRRFGAIASRGQMGGLVRTHALRFAAFSAVVLALGGVSRTLGPLPTGWLFTWLAAGLLLTALPRVLVALTLRRLQQQGVLTEVIAVVGAGPVADRLVQVLGQAQPNSIELLGVFDDDPDAVAGNRASGTLDQLLELGKTRKIDWILLTLPPAPEQRLQSIVQRLKALAVPIGLCPQHIGLAAPARNIGYVGNAVPVTLLADRPINRWNAVFKSAEDLLIGGLITLGLLPVLTAIALAIKLTSPGPVIFKQRRHALNNREFDVYKFRTMRWNPAASTQALRQTSRDDNRITRIGRFLRSTSLDELPQLFNVLKGEMSLVGPRPHAVDMRTEARLGHEITDTYPHRHRVKPGITGWSQVNGARGATDTTAQLRRRVDLDLHYIDHWSLLLDLKILALTSRVVVQRTNAY
jgi:Undecaprenyl-phosphate glucose phosphotransferase